MAEGIRALLGDAVTYSEDVAEIEDVIISLSKAQAATAALLDGYRNAVIKAELQWRKIEARPDYPYSSRDEARTDVLKEYCKKQIGDKDEDFQPNNGQHYRLSLPAE